MCCYFKKKVLDWKGYVKYSWKLIVWDVNFVVFSCFRSSREVKKCKVKRWYNGQYRRHHVKLGMCMWNFVYCKFLLLDLFRTQNNAVFNLVKNIHQISFGGILWWCVFAQGSRSYKYLLSSRKRSSFSTPIRFKPKTNCVLVTRVFPRFWWFCIISFWDLIGSSWHFLLFWLAVVISLLLLLRHFYNRKDL